MYEVEGDESTEYMQWFEGLDVCRATVLFTGLLGNRWTSVSLG